MAYQTLKKTRILRYGRWVEVDENYMLTEKEAEECPNPKAWIRWGVIKEVPEPKNKKRAISNARRLTKAKKKSKSVKKTERKTAADKTEKKPQTTTAL